MLLYWLCVGSDVMGDKGVNVHNVASLSHAFEFLIVSFLTTFHVFHLWLHRKLIPFHQWCLEQFHC